MLSSPLPQTLGNGICHTGVASHVHTNTTTTHTALVQDLVYRHHCPSAAHQISPMHWRGLQHVDIKQQHQSTSTAQQLSPFRQVSSHAERDTLSHPLDVSFHCLEASISSEVPQQQHSSTLKQQQSSSGAQQQITELQAVLTTVDMTKAVTKHPLLLSYAPATLQKHMQQLELLVGADAAAAMVVKMPQLLHYKGSTLAAKLDHLYDLLPEADVSKMVLRSPTLLGIATDTLTDRFWELQPELAGCDVQRMAEYCPSILECKVGKVVHNLKALKEMLPEEVDWTTVVQHMPTLLLSNIKKVQDKYMRLQILCMHKPRWRRDLIAVQHKPATFARLLGVSHRVIDRLAFLLEQSEAPELGVGTILLMSRAKFEARFSAHHRWLQHRDAAQHTNAWQDGNAMDALSSLDQQAVLSNAA